MEQFTFGDSLPFNPLSCVCTSGLWPGTAPCTQTGREQRGSTAGLESSKEKTEDPSLLLELKDTF